MSRTTVANAKTELAGLLGYGTTPTVADVDMVYDWLPQRAMLTEPVSVCVYTDGINGEFWQLAVGVFVLLSDDERVAQGLLDTILPALDAVTNNGGFGPSAWSITYPQTRGNPEHYIAVAVYQVGREDI